MTLIAELTYDYPQAFEAVWVAFGITSLIFFSLAGTVSKLDKKTWHEGYIISLLERLNGKNTTDKADTETLVDCDADPFIPEGWTVESHTKMGMVDVSKMETYLTDKQKTGYDTGNNILKALQDKKPLNANVLDWLLKEENQKHIPEEWKKGLYYFWGTIYRVSDCGRYVRCLCWGGGRWVWGDDWVGRDDWDADSRAVVLASS